MDRSRAVTMGLRVSAGSPIDKSIQSYTHWATEAILWGEGECTLSESQEMFSTQTSGQLILLSSPGAASDGEAPAETVGWGGRKGGPSPSHAFCFMATCPHLQGKKDGEAVFLLAGNK